MGQSNMATSMTHHWTSTQYVYRSPSVVFHSVLPLMGLLGSVFSGRSFRLVAKYFLKKQLNNDEAASTTLHPDRILEQCCKRGLIRRFRKDQYRWQHDKIQEAALSMMDRKEVDEVQYKMGMVLMDGLSTEQLDEMLFVVANLLHAKNVATDPPGHDPRDQRTNSKVQLKIIQLNLRAGQKAINAGLFVPAFTYLSRGIHQLPSDYWKSRPDLSLELFSKGAQSAFCNGNFEDVKFYMYCENVREKIIRKERKIRNLKKKKKIHI